MIVLEREPKSEGAGDPATRLLVEAFYAELHRLAHRERRRISSSSTLTTTSLVHEAYLKLFKGGRWSDRAHFLNTAAMAMRQALVSHARERLTAKRGSGSSSLPLEEADGVFAVPEEKVVLLDDALKRLEERSPRLARVVECRYFAGYTEAETAAALGVTERTVQRDWAKAKALLYESLGADA